MNRELQANTLNRLASAQGHLGAVRQMIADDQPCPHVIYQLRAIRSALVQVEEIMIREHLRHCLSHTALAEHEGILEEIAELWNYSPTPRLPNRGSRTSNAQRYRGARGKDSVV